ncbi:Uncharacterised protein [Kluyvera cryocrescens]|uniref:Uncharacterized protein n=1 Tax=Kluyvera cryocrescens TaxID=580 RepID=A0A485BJQ3_KLUCR|nr:Uncharacterised protein [Kluyvera cryocrescens]
MALRTVFILMCALLGGFLSVTSQAKSAGISENQIKQRIIEESIAAILEIAHARLMPCVMAAPAADEAPGAGKGDIHHLL